MSKINMRTNRSGMRKRRENIDKKNIYDKKNFYGVSKARFIVGYKDDFGFSREDYFLDTKEEAILRKRELKKLTFSGIYIKKRVR